MEGNQQHLLSKFGEVLCILLAVISFSIFLSDLHSPSEIKSCGILFEDVPALSIAAPLGQLIQGKKERAAEELPRWKSLPFPVRETMFLPRRPRDNKFLLWLRKLLPQELVGFLEALEA